MELAGGSEWQEAAGVRSVISNTDQVTRVFVQSTSILKAVEKGSDIKYND